MAACDHPDAVAAIGAAAKAAGVTLTLLVDLDPGLRRTGVADARGRRGARPPDRRATRR